MLEGEINDQIGVHNSIKISSDVPDKELILTKTDPIITQ